MAGDDSSACATTVQGPLNGGLWRVKALGGVHKDFVKMTSLLDEVRRKSVKVRF